MAGGKRVASVSVREMGDAGEGGEVEEGGARLAASLLAVSPRVQAVEPGRCRVDARGWERLGGEEALARALVRAVREAGGSEVRVGIADVAVAADAAARLATGKARIVPPGAADRFLAPLPLSFLPLPEALSETFRALGLRRIGELAALEGSELEARFGPAGIRAHRWARGKDDRVFRPLPPEDLPEASLELEGPVASREPLLFALRHLLARICEDLTSTGRRAARLDLRLAAPDLGGRRREGRRGGRGRDGERDRDREGERELTVAPARPTAREDLLFELCRGAVERELEGRLQGPVEGLAVRVTRAASSGARQGDLFLRRWRDPLAADAALSRLRSRVGRDGVVRPAPRSAHRPEARNRWEPVTLGGEDAGRGEDIGRAEEGGGRDGGRGGRGGGPVPSSVLRLLPRPHPVRVRTSGRRPRVVWDGRRRHRVTAAEGPERLSGDWWKAPYRREYYRACTSEGAILWLFREPRGGGNRWWLHGWWD